jgi:16S rRNA (cytosine1402-N4)-methyltransferase
MELHKPVLLDEVLSALNPRQGESYFDLTAGMGGHAEKILEATQNYKDSVLNDRDEFAIKQLSEKFSEKPVTITKGNFYNTALRLVEYGKTFDLVLADFGVSSPQLDCQERGFSFAKDGPLDMRMDREQELTAERVVNHFSAERLTEMFVRYGEESENRARRIAIEIARGRPWSSTTELAEKIRAMSGYSKVHPATRIFQAIRIYVNDELGEIEKTLRLLPALLNKGGRVGIISFHSLEDRLVKEYFREEEGLGIESRLKILTKKPVVASEKELVINPRARSAKLRAATRI